MKSNSLLYKIKSFLSSYKNSNYSAITMDKYKFEKIQTNEKLLNRQYSVKLVHILLSKYYGNLKKIYENSIDMGINVLIDDTLFEVDTTVGFIETLEFMKSKNILSNTEIKKLKFLKSLIEYDTLVKKIYNTNFNYYYMQENKTYECKKIIDMLYLDNDTFLNELDKNMKEETLLIYLYFIKEFINDNNFIIPKVVKDNANIVLEKAKKFYINEVLEFKKNPDYMNNVKINKKFKDKIMNEMPSTFSKIDKAFYIYLRLCNILTYDVIQVNGSKSNIDHSSIERLEQIDQNNNVIMCYEFIAIYAKFLEELGIEYQINGNGDYGEHHINLSMKYQDSIITVEPTRGVIDCDLTNAKLGIKLSGFDYHLLNSMLHDKIEKAINNIYVYYKNKFNIEYLSKNDLIEKNRNECRSNLLTLDEKFDILVRKLLDSNLPPVEIVKQLSIIRDSIFKSKNLFNYFLIADSKKMSYPENISISIVLVYNKYGIDNIETNNYYIYTYPSPRKIKKITKEELQINFDKNKYSYVKSHKKVIPGIKNE